MLRRPLPMFVLLVVAFAVGAGIGLPGAGKEDRGAASPADDARVGTVVRVVDGDTIHVMVGGRKERVRYIGVDTPESVKPASPVECYAKAASARNRELVEGERVRLETDVEKRDRYDRLLAYVHRARDGLFVNAELVRGGYASVLTIPPDVRHAERFRALAAEARRARRGLWGSCPAEAAKRAGRD